MNLGRLANNFLKNLGKGTGIRHWPVIFHVILIEFGLSNSGETRADLICEGKHLSESDQLTIDIIGVANISIQSFTKLEGIGSKSDDLRGADRTRRSLGASRIQSKCTDLVSLKPMSKVYNRHDLVLYIRSGTWPKDPLNIKDVGFLDAPVYLSLN